MRVRFKLLIAAASLVGVFALTLQPLSALACSGPACVEVGAGPANQGGSSQTVEGLIPRVINTLLFFVGALSVVMLIVGGINYTTSAGDQSKVTKAKNTVTYAVVGLVVSILALVIVNFVNDQIGGGSSGGGSGGGGGSGSVQQAQ